MEISPGRLRFLCDDPPPQLSQLLLLVVLPPLNGFQQGSIGTLPPHPRAYSASGTVAILDGVTSHTNRTSFLAVTTEGSFTSPLVRGQVATAKTWQPALHRSTSHGQPHESGRIFKVASCPPRDTGLPPGPTTAFSKETIGNRAPRVHSCWQILPFRGIGARHEVLVIRIVAMTSAYRSAFRSGTRF